MKNASGTEVCDAVVCRAKVLPLLFQMGQLITGSEDLSKSLAVILQIMERHLGVVRGMITLFHRTTGKIFIHQSLGLSDEEQARGVYKLGEGITGRVVETGKSIVVSRISEEPAFLNRTANRGEVEQSELSFLCVPILRGSKVMGTISAERRFDSPAKLQQDMELLTIIASMVAQEVELYLLETVDYASLQEENKRLQSALEQKSNQEKILGTSKPMQDVFAMVSKIAKTKTTVLILGESGVGKELVASSIHESSTVAHGPFVKFNCAALPESIVESELFGHEKGAFTGASSHRVGRFEEAHGGTIFLDEVGELSLALQAKFLRVLQEKTFERVGGNKSIKVDIRILAATNRDLSEMVSEGKFRNDLYYRLNVFPIVIPPLRERGNDIVTLCEYFVRRFCQDNGVPVKSITKSAMQKLLAYPWPGNVRELENVMERAVILCDGDTIRSFDLPNALVETLPFENEDRGLLESKLDALEYEMLVEALRNANGNMTLAGKEIGLTKRMMGIRMKKFGLDFKTFRSAN